MDDRVKRAIREATDLAAANHRDIAVTVGVTPLTLSHWRSGRRNPTPGNLAELGRVLLGRARALESTASELMRLAQEEARKNEREDAEHQPPIAAMDLFDEERGAA